MLPGFIFGEGTNTPDAQTLQKRRQVVDQLLASSMPRAPQTFGEGLTAIGMALAGRMQDKRLREKEDAERERVGGQFSQITGALLGGGQGGQTQSSPDPMAGNRPPVMDDAARMGGGGDMSKYRSAIASIESDGSGGYAAIGPTHSKLGRALGRYQVMEANIGPWSKAALGREVTPEEFLASPEIQDAVFDNRFGQYVQRHGPEAAAQAWFAGEGGIGQLGRKDSLGTTVGAYTDKFSRAIGGGQTAPVQMAQGQPQGMGGIDETVMGLMSVIQNPYADPAQKMIAQQLVQQRMQAADPMRQMEMQGAQLGLERDRLEIEGLRNPQPGYRVLTAQEAASMGLPDGAFQVGGDGKVSQIGGAGTNVNVSVGGEGAPGLGKLSTDYGYVLDPETRQPVIDPATGLPQAAPVPGSAAARDIEALQASRSGMETMTARQLNPTIDDITTARDLASNGMGTTGMMSGLIQSVPGVGQNAVDMAGTIDAIGSGISLENLNQMRQNSPTGGALGNVSDKQSALLSEAFGSLRQSMSREQFLYNLARVENSLNDIVHGEGNGPERHNMTELRARLRSGGGGSAGATAPARAQPTEKRRELDEHFLTDTTNFTLEELRAYNDRTEELLK